MLGGFAGLAHARQYSVWMRSLPAARPQCDAFLSQKRETIGSLQ